VDGMEDPAAVVAVARFGATVEVGDEARGRIRAARRHVERISSGGRAVYGVNTGFGALANTRIAPEAGRELQRSLLLSHAAGVGPFVEPEVVRGMMAVRVKTLAMGLSGVRVELVDALAAMLNAGVVPAVPEHGSLGASGDLAPLAHVGLCLCGEGWALEDGEAVPAAEALSGRGLEPFVLREKEGLSLINGTDGMLPATRAAVEKIRERVPFTARDRFLAPDLKAMQNLVESGEAVRAAMEITESGRAARRKP
ncbi:MAG: aromatic amino acid lyase, partial [Actinomycetota bacterium]|nr:aromatic amino acid lyase [Actinomycetota bacterium]